MDKKRKPEDEIVSAVKCAECTQLYPVIHRASAPVTYDVIFDWLDINGYSILCATCTLKKIRSRK